MLIKGLNNYMVQTSNIPYRKVSGNCTV